MIILCNMKCLKLLEKLVDVVVDLIRLFFIDEMGCAFHHNNFLQQRNIFLEITLVYEFPGARYIVNQVQFSNDEFGGYFYLSACPRRSKFPCPAVKHLKFSNIDYINLNTPAPALVCFHGVRGLSSFHTFTFYLF